MSLTRCRRLTTSDSCGTYSAAPVASTVRNSTALVQCNTRSPRSNRRSAVSDGRVVAAIGTPDPRVDVVPVLLPVSGDHLVGELDPVQPFQGLVAVHRRHVHPDRAAVLAGHGRA